MSMNNISAYNSVRNYNYQNYVNSYGQVRANTHSNSGCCCCNRNPIGFLTDYHNAMQNLVSSADELRDINSSGITRDYTVSSSNENVASAALRWPMGSPKEIALSSMKSWGLKKKGDGMLSFDKDAFRNNLKQHPDMIRDLLSGQFGFAQRVYQRALNSLSADPESLLNLENSDTFFSSRQSYNYFGFIGKSFYNRNFIQKFRVFRYHSV